MRQRDTSEFDQQLHPLVDGQSAELLGWSPDSGRLLYQDGGDLREVEPGADAAPRTVLSGAATGAAYLDSGELAIAGYDDEGSTVEALDPATGETRLLFRLPGTDVLALVADPTGQHLLVRGEDPTLEAVVYVWSAGGEPEHLRAAPVGDVAWVPEVNAR